MAVIKVWCEFHESGVRPATLTVDFAPFPIPWELPVYYITLNAPYPQHHVEEFYEGSLSAAVYLEDLLVTPGRNDRIGISLKRLSARCEQAGCSQDEIRQLVIRLADIEEALQAGVALHSTNAPAKGASVSHANC